MNSLVARRSWSARKRRIDGSSPSRSYPMASTRLKSPAPTQTTVAEMCTRRRNS
jgi:hypothetical protein